MSQDPTVSDVASTPLGNATDMPERVYLVSYPKIIFLYPTVLTALFCGIFMWAKGGIPQEEVRIDGDQDQVASHLRQVDSQNTAQIARAAIGTFDETVTPDTKSGAPADAVAAPEFPSSEPEFPSSEFAPTGDATAANAAQGGEDSTSPEATPFATDAQATEQVAAAGVAVHTYHNVCARIFLVVVALNLVVIAFDFPRTTSLTWFFAIALIVIALWFILTLNPWLAPKIVAALLKIKPAANASFYLIFAGFMIFLFLCVLISRRFDYWEVKGNELLHHHGFLSNLKRFSAPNLRIDKEINDLFEYMLLKSGRLIIHASNERHAIVLENVLFINEKEERITKMLGALQVRVRNERET